MSQALWVTLYCMEGRYFSVSYTHTQDIETFWSSSIKLCCFFPFDLGCLSWQKKAVNQNLTK